MLAQAPDNRGLVMLAIGSLAFASPWLLAALAALPVIWWLLRVTPPAPRRIAFQALQPKPWPADRKAALVRLQAMPLPQGSTAICLADGLEDGAVAPLADYLASRGTLRVVTAVPAEMPRLLAADAGPGELAGKELAVAVRSLPAPTPRPLTVRASAEDGALLAREPATIAPDA